MTEVQRYSKELAKYGIVLFFDAVTEAKLIELSRMIEEPNEIVLGPFVGKPKAHLSLFHFMMSESDIGWAVLQLKSALQGQKPITGKMSALTAQGRWLFAKINRSLELLELQLRVIKNIGCLIKQKVSIDWKMNEVQQQMYTCYGYPNVGDAWDIHVTFGRIQDGHPIPADLLNSHPFEHTWMGISIGLVPIGANGTVKDILHLFPLRYAS